MANHYIHISMAQQGESMRNDVFANGEDSSNPSFQLSTELGAISRPIPRRRSIVKDPNSRPKDRKKTVSFSSMPNEKKVVNAPDCLSYMQNGCELIKVRSNSRQYHRFFTLNADCTEIRWHPSSKKASKARIAISEIKEVRAGKNTEVLRNKDVTGQFAEECAFSIIYSDQFCTMDLMASCADEANIWVTGLTCLLSKNKGDTDSLEERQQLRDQWLLGMFENADKNQSGQIDERQVVELVKQLNTALPTTNIHQKLKELAIRKEEDRGRLTSSEFISLFKEIATRPEIYFLLVRYASASDHLTAEDLSLFLEAEQGMTRVSRDRCLEVINQHEPSSEGRKLGYLGIDGFTSFLLSNECDAFDVTHASVTQDMTQPLSHYFIASSHKTYLLEDQLKGPSSVEGYIRALLKGARYIELDTWDGPNQEPVVWHGHTLTSKVSFKSVIEAINQYAFKTSQFPVILGLENHCTVPQQQVMVKCLTNTLGEKLYTPQVDTSLERLPSPAQLKGKILIKGKKLSPSNKDTVNEAEEGYVTEEDEAEADRRNRGHKKIEHQKRIKLCRELSDLVTYCRSTRFLDFQTAANKQKCYELCSFSESVALKLSSACAEDFVTYNKGFLSRVYPNSVRVDSTNFNPQDLWNSGCQLVAMNYQTAGPMMDLNDGRFLANGQCGYVLKPAVMRDDMSFFSANTRDVIPGVSPQLLHVKIISGQNLPKPRNAGSRGNTIDPYVSVEVFGIPADCADERTKTVQHDGCSPLFDESFEFQVNLPELALVRFAVLDDDYIGDEFIGQYTIPFECMQTGYRHIRLKSINGEDIPNCTLFIHIAITNKSGGGQKGPRRRLSVGRVKRNRPSNVSLKPVGVRILDDLFKEPVSSLRQSIDLREAVHTSLSAFKESCGVAESSNIKQCIRTLASRVQMSSQSASLTLSFRDDVPYFESSGNLPESFKKAISAFEAFVGACKNLMSQSKELHEKLTSHERAALSHQEEIANLAQQQGLKGKKLSRAMENYAWNIRMLKGQADLIQQSHSECVEYLVQAREAGLSLGLTNEELSDSSGTCVTPETAHSPELGHLISSPSPFAPRNGEKSDSVNVKNNETDVFLEIKKDANMTSVNQGSKNNDDKVQVVKDTPCHDGEEISTLDILDENKTDIKKVHENVSKDYVENGKHSGISDNVESNIEIPSCESNIAKDTRPASTKNAKSETSTKDSLNSESSVVKSTNRKDMEKNEEIQESKKINDKVNNGVIVHENMDSSVEDGTCSQKNGHDLKQDIQEKGQLLAEL